MIYFLYNLFLIYQVIYVYLLNLFPLYRQSQAKHSRRPKVDPRQTSVLLFPGQGTQYVGE